tara:strand:- start:147 stop:755 length:609 start_codon:yes stop_codon:yes gene_type:complete
MYNKIINPKTNRAVNINSKQGKDIITTYYNILKGAGENVSRFPVTRTDHSEIWSISGPPPPPDEEQEGGRPRGEHAYKVLLNHRRRGRTGNARSNTPKWWKIRTDNNRTVWIQFRLGGTGEELVRALHYRYPNAWDCGYGGDLYHDNHFGTAGHPIGNDRLMDWVTDDNDPSEFELTYTFPEETDDSDDSDDYDYGYSDDSD